MKKTFFVMSLVALLVPVVILTTVFLATPSNYVRVQAGPCVNGSSGEFTAYLDSSTKTEGTPVEVTVIDSCDPVGTQVGAVVSSGGCPWNPASIVIYTTFALTGQSGAPASGAIIVIPTTSLSPGSYCVRTASLGGNSVYVDLPLTVTSGGNCFTAQTDRSTITMGESPVMLTVTDYCDPQGTRIGMEIRAGECPSTTVELSLVAVPTDDTYHMSYPLDTSGLGVGPHCVVTWPPGHGSSMDIHIGLTVTMGTPPSGGSCITASLSASTITEGTSSVTVSGTDTCPGDSAGTSVLVVLYTDGCPHSGSFVGNYWATTEGSGAFSTNIPTSSLGAGSYCVWVRDHSPGVELPLTVTMVPPPSGGTTSPSPRVHVATPGTPFAVGQPVHISYSTDVDGNSGVAIESACAGVPACPPVWAGSTGVHISGGLAYDVTAPGLSTPGTYYAVVEFVPDVGGGYEYGWSQFQVVGGGGGAGFDFGLSLSPSSLSVAPGGTANYQVLVTYTDPSYSGTTIHVQISGLGPGMNYQLITSPPGLRISTAQTTPAGSYTIILTGSAMGVTHQASAMLSVQGAEQAFDFSISASPLDRIVNPGGSVTYTVTVDLAAGTAQSIALSLPDAPAGITVAFSQTSASPPFTSTMTISAEQSASPGKYPLTVTGVGGGRTHTAPVTLVVEASLDFRVEVDPPSQTMLQGQTAKYVVHVAGLNGFNSQVSMTVNGLPSGANGVFSVPSSSPDFTTTLIVTIPGDSPTGTFTLTITGSGSGISRVANAVLTVNPTQSQTQTPATTQTGGGPPTPNDLLGMIQQNSLLVIGLLAIVIVLFGVLALRGRGRRAAPQQQVGLSPMLCGKCGTENPPGNEFCANCGQRLQ